MVTLLIVLHVVVCLFLVVIVLLQQGKGADIGATFGGGGSQTLFGTEGPLPLLNKITTGAAVIFMLTSVTLAYFSSHTGASSVMDEVAKQPVKVEKTVTKKEVTAPAPAAQQSHQVAAPAQEQKTAPVKKKDVTAPAPAVKQPPQAAAPAQEQKNTPVETKKTQ
jgi:preprotein translocase subunit SecG